MEWVSIDSTHVRTHQSSSGAASKKPQAIAKSRGGNSSKIHLAVDAHGNPIEFLISDGVTHDIKLAPKLLKIIDLSETKVLNADKGYDSDELRYQIKAKNECANIPKKKILDLIMTTWIGIFINLGI